jgi:hypothetical protein
MNKHLQTKFYKLETSREKIIPVFVSSNSDTLKKKPAADKWSALQILNHIIKTEQMSMIALKRGLKDFQSKEKTGLAESIKTILLRVTLNTPLKFKAPKGAGDIPEQPILNDMLKKWEVVRKDLKDFFDTIPQEAMKKNLFNHPYSGKMNIFHAADFLVSHSEHHYRQIKKLVRPS